MGLLGSGMCSAQGAGVAVYAPGRGPPGPPLAHAALGTPAANAGVRPAGGGPVPEVTQGAFVPISETFVGGFPLGCGGDERTFIPAGFLTRSGCASQGKRVPKWKCWTTGNLERTSALYIFSIPYRPRVSKSARTVQRHAWYIPC